MAEPIVLKVLKIPYFLSRAVLFILLSICALPTYMYLKLTEPVVRSAVFQSYGFKYVFMGIFRWIFSVAFWPWIALQGYAVYALVTSLTHNESEYVQKISVISSLIAVYSGLVLGFFGIQHFGQKKLKLNKIGWIEYWHSAWDAQLDMLTGVLTLIVMALLLRIRQLFQWPSKTRQTSYRKHLMHQFLFSIIDWLVAPFYLIVVLTYWRYHELASFGMRQGELAQRAETIFTAFKVLLDVPVFVLVVPMTLTLWRAGALWKDIGAVPASARRAVVLRHFGQWLIDAPFIVFGVASIVFVWRIPSLIKRYKEATTAGQRRKLAIDNFFCGLLDLPALVMFAFIHLLRWHVKEYSTVAKDKRGIEWHFVTMVFFIVQVIDVPTVLLYLLLMLTVYKFKNVNEQLSKVTTPRDRRNIVYREAFTVIVDILSAVAFVFVFITRWHYSVMLEETNNLPQLAKGLKRIEYIFITLIDMPSIIVSVILLLSWRTVKVWKFLNTEINSRKRRVFVFGQLLLLILDIPKPLIYAIIYISRWHWIELKLTVKPTMSEGEYTGVLYWEFLLTLLELPVYLLLLINCVSWRTVSQYRHLKLAQTISAKRFAVLEQSACLVLDILTAAAGLIVAVCVWYWSDMRAAMKDLKGLKKQGVAFRYFGLTLLSLPVILQALTVVLSWRRSDFLTRMKVSRTDSEKKDTVRMYFACVFFDPWAAFAHMCLRLNPWRAAMLPGQLANLAYRERQNKLFALFFDSVVDFPFLVMYLIIFITYYRLKSTRERMPVDSIPNKRYVAMMMFMCLVFDLPMVLARAYIKLTRWHAPDFETDVKQKLYFDVHATVFKHFLRALYSLPFMLAAVVVFCTGWRAPTLYRELGEAKSVADKRGLAIEQLIALFLDIFALVFYIVVTLLLWHRTAMRAELKDKRGLYVHAVITKHFLMTLVDLPFILMTFVVFATVGRSKVIYRQLKATKTNSDKRYVALLQFSLLFVDVPAVLCAFVVLVTGFKAPKMYRRVKEAILKINYNELTLSVNKNIAPHVAVFYAFFELLIDIPFSVLFVFIIIFHWRYIIYRKKVQLLQSYWRRRLQLSKQAALVLLDVPCAVLLVLLLLSWRRKQVWNILKAEIERIRNPEKRKLSRDELMALYTEMFAAFGGLLVDVPFAILSLALLWRAPAAFKFLTNSTHSYEEWRGEVWRQFQELVVDLVFVLIAVLTVLAPWRLIFLVYRIAKLKTAQERRQEVFAQLDLSVKDFALTVESVLLIGTLWRIVPLIRRVQQHTVKGFEYRKVASAVHKEFVHWLKDLPFVPLCLVTLIYFWRIPFLVMQIVKASNNSYARRAIVRHFLYGPADIFCLALGTIIVATLWRSLRLIEALQRSNRKHTAVLKQFGYWLGDFVLIEHILFIFLTVNQIHSFVARSVKFYKRYRTLNRSILASLFGLLTLKRIVARFFGKTGVTANLFDVLPQEVILQVMSYLPSRTLVNVSLSNQLLKQVSDDESLWAALWRKDFPGTASSADSYRLRYADLAMRQSQLHDEDVYTYRLGYAHLIRDEHAKAWRRIHHFFLIPFKIIGYLCTILHYVTDWNHILLQYMSLPMPLNRMILRRNGISDLVGHVNWWRAHVYGLLVLLAFIATMILNLLTVQIYLRLVVLRVISLGGLRLVIANLLRSVLFVAYVGGEVVAFIWTSIWLHRFAASHISWWILYLAAVLALWALNVANHLIVWFNEHHYFTVCSWRYNPFTGFVLVALLTKEILAYFFFNIVLSTLRAVYKGLKAVADTVRRVVVKLWQVIAQLGRFIANKVVMLFNANRGFLRKATIFTHKFGAVGDLLLIPISLSWMCWPLAVPYFMQVKTWVPWVPAAFFSLLLMRRGYTIVKGTYDELEKTKGKH